VQHEPAALQPSNVDELGRCRYTSSRSRWIDFVSWLADIGPSPQRGNDRGVEVVFSARRMSSLVGLSSGRPMWIRVSSLGTRDIRPGSPSVESMSTTEAHDTVGLQSDL
jgi:hypothetical protein